MEVFKYGSVMALLGHRSTYDTLAWLLLWEVKLRATQYLPDIVRLQRFLYDTFNRRYDKSAAATMINSLSPNYAF